MVLYAERNKQIDTRVSHAIDQFLIQSQVNMLFV